MLSRKQFFGTVLSSMVLLCAACSQQAVPKPDAKQPLLISAAASTKEVMETLADQFKTESGIEVKINPGPSSGLAAQIEAVCRPIYFCRPASSGPNRSKTGGMPRR